MSLIKQLFEWSIPSGIKWKRGDALPNPELQEPQEFLDETWLQKTYLEESALQGLRLSRPLISISNEAHRRELGDAIDVQRDYWFREVQKGRAAKALQFKVDTLPEKLFPFAQIFRRVHDSVTQRRAPATWPLAVMALLDGIQEGYHLQCRRFADHYGEMDRLPFDFLTPHTTLEDWSHLVPKPITRYVGSQWSDSSLEIMNKRRQSEPQASTLYRRLNKRDPALYKDVVKSLIQGFIVPVEGEEYSCLPIVGYRRNPAALIFFRMSPGTTHEVPLPAWMDYQESEQTVNIVNLDLAKPMLAYELPMLWIG